MPRYWLRLTRCPVWPVSVKFGAGRSPSEVPGSRYGLVASVAPVAVRPPELPRSISSTITTISRSAIGNSAIGLTCTPRSSPRIPHARTALRSFLSRPVRKATYRSARTTSSARNQPVGVVWWWPGVVLFDEVAADLKKPALADLEEDPAVAFLEPASADFLTPATASTRSIADTVAATNADGLEDAAGLRAASPELSRAAPAEFACQ